MSKRPTPETDKIIRNCKSPADTSSWVAMTMLCMRLERQRDEAMDKAIRFDLDKAGIESREREAVELVELRALRDELVKALHYSCKCVPDLATVPGIKALLARLSEQSR